jgi:chaperonin GroEL
MDNYCTKINEKTDEVLLAIKKSSQKIADIVSQTAGPYGHNVMLINGKSCRITKDGISVLRSITEPETESDFIALSVIRSASDETNRKAGDGTTATCILANEIFQQGYNFLTAGCNGNLLRNGITKASEIAQKLVVDNLTTPVKDDKDIYNVAKISSNGSDEIAKILTDVFSKIGKDGMARVELSNTDKTTSKIVYGMTIDRGYESPYFATNTHGEAVLDNPVILLINKRLSVLGELLKPFETLAKLNRPILVVAEGYDPDILNTFILNKMRGLPICAILAPNYGEHRTKMMEDLAVVTGGKVISPATGITLEQITTDPTIMGTAKQVIVNTDSTSFIADTTKIQKDRFDARVAEIKHELEEEKLADYDRNILKTRMARMVSGIGIISVGGATEAEMHEKKDLVDDSFASVSSSQKKGIVSGCGLTYLAIHDALYTWLNDHLAELSSEEASGFKVFADSLTKPFLTICGNSGHQNSQYALGIVQTTNRDEHANDTAMKNWTKCVDLGTGEMIDVMEKGIVDSAAAVIETMKNGAAAGAQLLSLSGVVNTPPKPLPVPPQA